MAVIVAIHTNSLRFFHIPKTAGTWVRKTIRDLGMEYEACEMKDTFDNKYGLSSGHSSPSMVKSTSADLLSFCFVRHPIGWYRSFWSYRQWYRRKGTSPHFILDTILDLDDDFDTFVNKSINRFGSFVTGLYKLYVGEDCRGVDYIGKQESATKDLIAVFDMVGEQYDLAFLENSRRYKNMGSMEKFKRTTHLKPSTEREVIRLEKWVLDNFYKETQ